MTDEDYKWRPYDGDVHEVYAAEWGIASPSYNNTCCVCSKTILPDTLIYTRKDPAAREYYCSDCVLTIIW